MTLGERGGGQGHEVYFIDYFDLMVFVYIFDVFL